ncbi:MAG: aspartate carbamoyltransferase [Candidatus Aenigmatarchaeota archaeon]
MWNRKDILSVDELSRKDIEFILDCAKILEPFSGRGNKLDLCRGEILITAFFEPSTRTEMSFTTAMHTLGGDVQNFKPIGSSLEKGESKEDTVRILEQYCDILAIRDPGAGSVKKYADLVNVPVINAGDGSDQHPTQAMLDLYTIKKEFGRLDDLVIVFTGDLKFGRTVHSLIKALRKFNNNRFFGISPKGLEMPEYLKNGDYTEIDIVGDLDPDVIYATRIQKERMPAGSDFKYEINKKFLDLLPAKTRIMHPLPRVGELNPEIDDDPRFIPFKQARHGVHVRMAILAILLGHENGILKLSASKR